VKTTSSETTLAGAQRPETETPTPPPAKGSWRVTKVPNLLQYRTGNYFARVKVKGKTIKLCLHTNVFTTAKLLLADKLKEIRKFKPEVGTFGQARAQYEAALEQNHTLSAGTRYYRKNCLKALATTWPELDGMSLRRITATACQEWAHRFTERYDEQYFNNTLGSLRAILTGAGFGRDDNPPTR